MPISTWQARGKSGQEAHRCLEVDYVDTWNGDTNPYRLITTLSPGTDVRQMIDRSRFYDIIRMSIFSPWRHSRQKRTNATIHFRYKECRQ